MSMRVVQVAQIATTKKGEGMLPVCPATVYRWVRQGKFPAPFQICGLTVWDRELVEDFIVKSRDASLVAAE